MIKTEILDGLKDLEQAIQIAGDSLLNNEPLVFPTETVYGVGALIYNENAIRKVFEIKERNYGNPLSAHISTIEDVNYLCDNIPELFWKIAEKFLPGPISIILEKNESVPDIVTGGLKSINIRMPDNFIFSQLSKYVNQPIAATSANLSGRPSPNTAITVFDDLNNRVKYIIDGGRCKYAIESTIISLIGSEPVLIRPGVIEQTSIEAVLNMKLVSNNRNLVKIGSSYQSSINRLSFEVYICESIEIIKEYLNNEKSKNKVLLLLSYDKINMIDHNYKIILSVENLFESIRYAEKNNFDTIIILFDEFVKNIDLIKHRLKFAKKLG